MSEYPDEDEDFELMYGDELDLLREHEDDDIIVSKPTSSQPPQARKSLSFPTPQKENSATNIVDRDVNADDTFLDAPFEEISTLQENGLQLSNSLLPEPSERSVPSQEISNNRKRNYDDLFGEIDDILLEDEINPKRLKADKLRDKEAEELALIEQIVELRRKAREKLKISLDPKNYMINDIERNKRNISYRVPKYPFIGIKNHDDDRIYVRFHSEEYEEEETKRIVEEDSFVGVMGDSFKKTWGDAQEIINKQLEEENKNNEPEIVEAIGDKGQLWVDLYKPRKYLELLSDESTNRTMLRWIKLWDKVVFGRKPRVRQYKVDDNKKKFFKKYELNTTLDEHGRPEHKVALLCGPPGLGKTTLAHMVAKHAGYNVVEINASDDRSLDSFKTSLENATQMRSVIDTKGRPNCLVFDEIDGAPQSSIDFLVKFVNGTAPSKAKKGNKDNKKVNILKRPIICICNDVYVPALRPLRQIAFVVNFPQTSSARLAERLMEIAKRQQIKTDMGAMMALAEKSNNDIRSCLSILHFFKAQNKPVTLSVIYKASIGQKDMQSGLFSVWNDIFQIERPKIKPGDSGSQTVTLSSRMSKVLHVVSSFGDYDRLCQGVFENYPNTNVKDATFCATSEALNWFVFFDGISQKIHESQNYSLSSYLQYSFVVWHFSFATYQRPTLKYPSQGYEARTKQIRQQSLLQELLRGMQPTVRCYCQNLSLILDICPLLTRIITPVFRPVSLHLYTKEEKETLLRVVGVMIDYNLNYVQERTPAGTYVYNLEPNIEEITVFDKETQRRALPYPVKQLIAQEIDMEKMRRVEQPKMEADANKKEKQVKSNAKSTAVPNHLQKLSMKTVKKVEPDNAE